MVSLLSSFLLLNPFRTINFSLVSEALNTFSECVCFPESNEGNTDIILIAFTNGFPVLVGDCGNCTDEVRWSGSKGSPGRRLLLISDEEQRPDTFNYSEVILIQNNNLLRLDINIVKGRQFLPFHEASNLFAKEKIVNFEGRSFVAAYYDCPPLMYKKHFEFGLEFDLLYIMSKSLNFRIDFMSLKSQKWGKEANNTWVGGVIGSLVSGESDIGLCGVWIRSSILKHIDVSTPYGRMTMGFIISNAPHQQNWKSVYKPFSPNLWCVVFATLGLSISALFILSKLSGYKEGFVGWCFLVLGQFLVCCSLPSKGPTAFRAACTMVSIAALMVTTLYSSAIVSHLTKPPVVPEPKTMKDLFLSGYEWSRVSPVDDPSSILNIADEWQRRLIPRYRHLNDMANVIKEGRFAICASFFDKMFMWRDLPSGISQASYSQITRFKEPIMQHPAGIGFRKGSPLTAPFSLLIGRFVSTGIINKLSSDKAHFIDLKRQSLKKYDHDNSKVLTLNSFQGAFVLLLGGMGLSTIVFLIELLLAYCNNCLLVFWNK